MAYARYDRQCNWYIFWTGRDAGSRDTQALAVWHLDHRKTGPVYSYQDVRDMLASGDFSRIPGFQEADHELLRTCLTEFVHDVDVEFSGAA